jgi:hypothetical protein
MQSRKVASGLYVEGVFFMFLARQIKVNHCSIFEKRR